MLGFQIVAWYLGSVLAYVVGYLLLTFGGNGSWRWQLASGAVLCAFFLIIRQSTAPESPRWLAQHGKQDKAAAMIEQYLHVRVDPATLVEAGAEGHPLDHLGMGPTFLFAAVVTAVGFLICLWGAPETKGRDLEAAAMVAA
ncbi:MFS transporter [Nocardia sp. CA-136227]|uniref:MFS transporter n=1 Tax=Nocardia sp. CA-136227 TaxID=3239979 RepID=UPI003D998599